MTFKQALFEAHDREIEKVDTPAGEAYVRALTVAEKDVMDLMTRRDADGNPTNFRVQVLIACCCDESGAPAFDEFDAGAIGRLPSYLVEPILAAAIRINRWGKDEQEALRKNSPATPGDNSSSP